MKKMLQMLLLTVCLTGFLAADEGMWLLNQLKQLDLPAKGLKISVGEIYSPNQPSIASAVVHLGATGEIVSPEGLMLTNHHVAFGAVQRASTRGTDLITSGFLARTRDQEIEAPGYSARILEKMEDVTAQFRRYDRIRDLNKRERAIKKKIRRITERIEKGHSDISATVVPMFRGDQYMLFVYRRFDDVRVVYVPPQAIGNYGGDIDNWMWPRHTGDFSFLRIYMAPDGSGRGFNRDNVPYRPKYWIKVARDGLKAGDFTFIMGYPGRTFRYLTSNAVSENLNHYYPRRIRLYRDTIRLLESFQKDSLKAKMKVAGFIKGLNNALKNYQGNVDGMKRTAFLDKKLAMEAELQQFLLNSEKLNKKFGHVLPQLKKEFAQNSLYREYDDTLALLNRLSGTLAGLAIRAYSTSREREKPASLRNPLFSEKNVKRAVKRLRFTFMSFYEPADKALLKRTLEKAAALPEKTRISALDTMLKQSGQDIGAYIDNCYSKTKLKDFAFSKSLFSKNSRTLKALNDPLINLAAALYPEMEKARKRREKANARIRELRRHYIRALKAWKGKTVYPDANSTQRLSFGAVAGYQPRDAVTYAPFTTLAGVMEKETGKTPFTVPEKLKELYRKKDFGKWIHPELKDVPVAFTHKVDSTGGNSGSPVFNARGELAGILFDGNYEALTGDWEFIDSIQRSISVDIRYVLFITEKLAGADFLLKEMGIR